MALPMTRPTKHPKTGVYRLRVAIPASLREVTARMFGRRAEFIETLGTKDAVEAKRRQPAAQARIDGRLSAARAEAAGAPLVRLSDRAVAALVGRWLAREQTMDDENLPATARTRMPPEREGYRGETLLEFERGHIGDAITSGTALAVVRRDVDALLRDEGLRIDGDSRRRLGDMLARAKHEHLGDVMRRAEGGSWKPSRTAADFPQFASLPMAAASVVTFDDVLRGWALEQGTATDPQLNRRIYDHTRTLERLAKFLGHRDAAKVTRADAVRWKEAMLVGTPNRGGRPKKPASVAKDTTEMAALWAHALKAGKLPGDNPFAGLRPAERRRTGPAPRRPYTDAEAAKVLLAARAEKDTALRWLPWVAATTGARIAELAQSEKEDVGSADGTPFLRIHAEGAGRSVKSAASTRTVPLHPTLIAEGFPAYVASLPAGSPLFPTVPLDPRSGSRGQPASALMADWVRGLGITDLRVGPSHSWRHWFIDAARRVSMPEELRSALTGHAAKRDESANYGDGYGQMLQTLAEWVAKIRLPPGVTSSAPQHPEAATGVPPAEAEVSPPRP